MIRIGTRLEADLFEEATGQLVWSCNIFVGGSPFASTMKFTPLSERLFDLIEPAIPAVLTEPVEIIK